MHNSSDCTIEAHCLPLIEVFELLLRHNFTSFILTITTCTVAILVKSSARLKFLTHIAVILKEVLIPVEPVC